MRANAVADTPSVAPVTWTLSIDAASKAPGDAVEFLPRDAGAIYAVVRVANMPGASTLTATWTINDQSLEAFTSTVTIEQEDADGWVEFHLSWQGETYWPAGTLAITILASTGQETRSSIGIQ